MTNYTPVEPVSPEPQSRVLAAKASGAAAVVVGVWLVLSEAFGASGWLQLAVALLLAAGVVELVRRRTPNVRRYER